MKHVIAIESEKGSLSELQLKFNKIAQKVEKLKEKIKNAEKNITFTKQYVALHLQPLDRELLSTRISWVIAMDMALNTHKLSNADREMMNELICEHISDILTRLSAFEDFEEDRKPTLKGIFADYSGQNYDEMMAAQQENFLAEVRAMMASEVGEELAAKLDFDASKIANPVETAKMMQQLYELMEAYRDQQHAKKSPKQLEKEAAKAQELSEDVKQVKEIYTMLAKEFHPDLATDDADLARRTTIMQRVTDAKEKEDLMELIKIQLEFSLVQQEDINKMATQKIQTFIKILSRQEKMLKAQLESMTSGNTGMEDVLRFINFLSQKDSTSKKMVDEEVEEIKEKIYLFQEDIVNFKIAKEFKKLVAQHKRSLKNPFINITELLNMM